MKVMKRKLSIFVLLVVLSPMVSFAQIADEIKNLPKYGEDSVTCITNLSLYRESYKQWKSSKYKTGEFDHSYQYWKWVYDNCPKASLNVYVDGTMIMNDKITSAKDDATKEAYVDSLLMVYDQRIIYFGDKGNVLGRKGLDLLRYRPNNTREVFDLLSQSVDLEKDKTKDGVIDALFRAAIQLYKDEKADKSIILETYDKVMTIIDNNISSNCKEKEKYVNVKGSVESAFEPYASCEDLIPLYEKKFAENSEDIELLQKIAYMLDKKGCTSSELFEKVSKKYHELNPSPESALMLGKMMFKKEDYNSAIRYLNEATKIADPERLYNTYYLLAASYRFIDNFPKARDLAYEAAKVQPTSGEPYIFIGQLYGQSSQLCGGSNLVEKNCIYWAAVDMFMQAKRIDPSVTEEANKNINIYSQYFPTMESIFFSDLNEGDDYTVGCWINRTTKIRAAKE